MTSSSGENTGLRKATIMCLTDCYFATIDKESYNKVLAKENQKQTKANVEFFRSLPYISHWTKGQIEKLALDFNLKTYNRN